jgi:hypothetical protein
MSKAQTRRAEARNREIREDYNQRLAEWKASKRQKSTDANARERIDHADALQKQREALQERLQNTRLSEAHRRELAAQLERVNVADRTEARRIDAENRKNPEFVRAADIGALDIAQQKVDENRTMGLDPRGATTRTGRMSEGAASARADRYALDAKSEIDTKRLEVNSTAADTRKGFDADFATRIAPFNEAYNMIVKEGKEEVKSGRVDAELLPVYTAQQKRRFLDTSDKLAKYNDGNPETIARFVHGVTTDLTGRPPQITQDGKLLYGGERLTVDKEMFRRLMEMRGERLQVYRAAETKKWIKDTEAKDERAAGSARVRQAVDDSDTLSGDFERNKNLSKADQDRVAAARFMRERTMNFQNLGNRQSALPVE